MLAYFGLPREGIKPGTFPPSNGKYGTAKQGSNNECFRRFDDLVWRLMMTLFSGR